MQLPRIAFNSKPQTSTLYCPHTLQVNNHLFTVLVQSWNEGSVKAGKVVSSWCDVVWCPHTKQSIWYKRGPHSAQLHGMTRRTGTHDTGSSLQRVWERISLHFGWTSGLGKHCGFGFHAGENYFQLKPLSELLQWSHRSAFGKLPI